ncbi:MAG: NAD(P)-dependent alcohol dehydrogenase [Anaerolineales bacterium]|jgi:NADPH:quinone reductase-like Zn-dependent oxidoreductase
MQAIVQTKPGPPDVLELREVPKPVPKTDEVLVKVHAATVTAGDVVLRKLPGVMHLAMRLFMGQKRKEIPGHEFSGEIEAVGKDVQQFQPGERVFGTTDGLSAGANAEYVCLPEDGILALMPENASYAEAAPLPVGGTTALYFLREQGGLQSGHNVLVYGASGSVGTYAVQLARHFGADVTGVCSTRNLALVQSLGAARVIDYQKEDFTAGGAKYDLIFDAVGKTSDKDCQPVLAPGGTFVSVAKGLARDNVAALQSLKDLAEAGELHAVIDRTYSLAQVPEAHHYVESGRKAGNVVIAVVNDPTPAD